MAIKLAVYISFLGFCSGFGEQSSKLLCFRGRLEPRMLTSTARAR